MSDTISVWARNNHTTPSDWIKSMHRSVSRNFQMGGKTLSSRLHGCRLFQTPFPLPETPFTYAEFSWLWAKLQHIQKLKAPKPFDWVINLTDQDQVKRIHPLSHLSHRNRNVINLVTKLYSSILKGFWVGVSITITEVTRNKVRHDQCLKSGSHSGQRVSQGSQLHAVTVIDWFRSFKRLSVQSEYIPAWYVPARRDWVGVHLPRRFGR